LEEVVVVEEEEGGEKRGEASRSSRPQRRATPSST
jgi:hypothetical protein